MIHIELKSEYAKDGYYQAFDQIERYAIDGFFDGIFATVQIFVISNKVSTKYFARPSTNDGFKDAKKILFNWREPDNKPVEDLFDFTRKVLRIPMAHELVSRYTILVDDKKSQKFMMVLRPYQIHAIKKIMENAYNHKGGFIWHTTGSEKTITSFVATKLLAQTASGVSRTILIVDRKDFDSQTKGEFGKFASEYNTGLSSGDTADNTLIVGIDNKGELVKNIISKNNNNTIIITTIQKLSYAIREMREPEKYAISSEAKKKHDKMKADFEKLKGEHIVFIVDECHRAVSDKEMRSIKKLFPRSTWFGLTGTPIFEENQKDEVGTYARTTFDQYGELLHAYTTKNAMDDKSVLDFQVEYHSLMTPEEENRLYLKKVAERYPDEDLDAKLKIMDSIDKEALLSTTDYENRDYIVAMLRKIFRHQSILEKFKVVNGIPTMSGILTTHSIAQAKRIYSILTELKEAGTLIQGNPLDERRRLNDPDFPRVTITYSVAENPNDTSESAKQGIDELKSIMADYNGLFGTSYSDIDLYNQNINNRLSRKDAQYQKDGQWLDFVIVVDRLLTGFDSPTIQALYVDRELRYQKLLQAFSRTNRTYPNKDVGMIVTFRKPRTMEANVRDAIRLFSNEEREWEKLLPRQYAEVKQNFKAAYKKFSQAQKELLADPEDLKKRLNTIKTFQSMAKLGEAIKSYEDFEDDFIELSGMAESISNNLGNIENEKAAVKEYIQNLKGNTLGYDEISELLEIEFSSNQRATHQEKIDSYYITQLLNDIKNENSKQKFDEIIKNKPQIVKTAYHDALNSVKDESKTVASVDLHFKCTISEIISEIASILQVPVEDLTISFNEYNKDKGTVPYLNVIIDKCNLTKESFEQEFQKKFRERRNTIDTFWQNIIVEKLLPLKEELANYN